MLIKRNGQVFGTFQIYYNHIFCQKSIYISISKFSCIFVARYLRSYMAKIFKTSLFSGRILLRSEIDSPNVLAKKEVVMVTINDVARLAKVSRGTVSNVINGKNNVSLEKIKRVEEA